MKKLKVIFLDIDGVMRPLNAPLGNNTWCEPAFDALRRIIEKTEAKIVLSSTWRQYSQTIKVVNQQLEKNGISSIFSTTPIKSHSTPREQEILEWIHVEAPALQVVIENWIAIDDLTLFTNPEHQDFRSNNFIQTQTSTGLAEEHVEKAIQLLLATSSVS